MRKNLSYLEKKIRLKSVIVLICIYGNFIYLFFFLTCDIKVEYLSRFF